MTIPVWLAALICGLVAASFLNLAVGVRRLRHLGTVPPVPDAEAPLVSIVVAARNEARGIEAGLESLLGQRYPHFEVVVVDDRSTDATPTIIARMAERDPRIAAMRVEQLPEGWLGKNHALFTGATRARGDWLLFTDADVVFQPDTLARAVGHAISAGRDHVTLTPRLILPGILLQGFAALFTAVFCLWTQPWRASNPRSRFFIGIGAFNLVRREAYERAGTHQLIRLRPDDDLKLGKILKRAGASQELLQAPELIEVEWYPSIGALVRGLEKNAFAGLEYRVSTAVGGVLTQLFFAFAPLAGLLAASGAVRWLSAVTVGVTLLGLADATRGAGVPRWLAAIYPLFVLLFCFIVLRTTALNLAHGGIRWRDTFYPLSVLKTNRI